MTKKSVHQKLNLDAVKHFGIDCDPYGVIVDTVGENIETVQIDKSALNIKKHFYFQMLLFHRKELKHL